MNLRQLKYFVSVVESGNITRAAEQLNVAHLKECSVLVPPSTGIKTVRASSATQQRGHWKIPCT